MKVLVVGSGGREHALAWALGRSPGVTQVISAPGNPGMAEVGRCAPVAADRFADLVALARDERVDLVVVGPEAPLVGGLADACAAAGLRVFGPSGAAAAIEGSKAFAKELMARQGIPTGRAEVCATPEAARRAVDRLGAPVVVKADGLAAGKGVAVCAGRAEADAAIERIMVERAFGASGDAVVVEEYLDGEECSVLALAAGDAVAPLASSQDHKRAYDGDRGPNTGGMGAYSPAPAYDAGTADRVLRDILRPALEGMAALGRPYRGVLYAGLMLTRDGPKVLEFNCRFGDPEAQVVLPRLDEDLGELLLAVAEGRLAPRPLRWRDDACVTVALASGGYPERYATGFEIHGLKAAAEPGVIIFHAGTARPAGAGGPLVTAGGRVLNVSALGPTIGDAVSRAYAAVERIRFEGMHYRRDIAHRARAR